MSPTDGTELDGDELTALLDRGTDRDLRSFLELLHAADVAEWIGWVDDRHLDRLFRLLPTEKASQVLTEIRQDDQRRVLRRLSEAEIKSLIGGMETDDAADTIENLPEGKARDILEGIEDEEEIRELLRYPAETAGGLMQRELVSVPDGISVGEALELVRGQAEQVDEFHRVYVVDRLDRLLGAFSLRDLIISDPNRSIRAIADEDPVQVRVDVDQEEVARLVKKYDHVSIPVVDREGVLVGRIMVDDIVDVIEEEASEDFYLMAGTTDEELEHPDQVVPIARARLKWLLVTFVGEFFNVIMISRFELAEKHGVTLFFFVPLLVALGGGVGNQTSTITTRAIALGRLNLRVLARPIGKELLVGLLLGAVMGLLLSVVSYVAFQNALLSAILGTSMQLTLTVAAFMGVLTPILFEKAGFDPALAAGPIVGVSNDIVGILIYFATATFFLSLAG